MKRIEEYIGQEVDVIIDRPLGSKHPKYDFYYSVNYGFIPNTVSGDNEEIDAYVLGEYAPLQKYKGIVIGIIKRLNDNEDKLVVANNINRFTKEQVHSLTEFQEQFFESKIICLDYLKQSIRVTSKAIIRKENELLVIEARNKENEVSYLYLPGGGIEFKERSIDALHREIREELQTEIKECKFIAVIENQFKINNCELHEICFLYEVKLYEEFYKNVNFTITEDISINNSYWVNVEKIKNKSIKFYPEDAIKYLQ